MKLLLQNNFASHYRAPIYQLMDKEFRCDFCFGDKVDDIKKMDYSTLHGIVTEVHNVFFKSVEYQRGVIRLLWKEYDTYLIYSGTRCISTWLFLIIRKFFFPKKRVYGWSHGLLGKEKGLKLWLNNVQFKLFTGTFVYNERSRRLMIEQGVPAEKLVTIYNSLDYDKQLLIRQDLKPNSLFVKHFGNDNKNIVFIGRLTKVKRFDLLIEAISKLKERGQLSNVTFIGDGEERQNMERMADEKGIKDQIWFYGACYDEKTNAELIYNADLCVSPGNIGLTAIHVLMFGCPAITNDDFNHQMPEFEVIQDDETGSFFKADDSNSLADVISGWFVNHGDKREQVRQACYHVIDSKWNPHHQIEIMKKVLIN